MTDQITKIATDVKWIKKEVSDIKEVCNKIQTNCIPTINTKLARLDSNQKILLWFMGALVLALIGLFFRS